MKINRKHLVMLVISVILLTVSLFADFEIGSTYYGFKLLEKRFVKEVNAECLYFEHSKSGAHLFKIMDDDANKTFSIAFKTIPNSDAGTPHIMEHGVLNGSKNFPVKSPFDVLSKGSLKTFLNALTGSDVTIYPIASMNDKDYFNLMHIYLDAVFNPLIYDDPRILQQEGWHYELTDKDAPVEYRGIVYNEMKGAFSSPARELDYQINKVLFPDNAYSYSSGGYPTAIPSLTYDQYLNYHRTYYHPSNSLIFLYGNGDIHGELQFIDSEYLSKYKRSNAKISIAIQKPFEKMKIVTANYSAPEGSDLKDQSYLSMSFVAGMNVDRKLVAALDILTDVLVNQESAPIRLALQKAGIGRDVSAGLNDFKQNVVQINVQNANPEDASKFSEIVMNSFQDAIRKGVDKQSVEATLNRLEFKLREGDDAQKGLTYLFSQLNGWLYADDPFLTLEWEKSLADLKTGIQEDYLETVLDNYFLHNNHAVLMTLQPKPGMEKEINAKTAAELADYKASLSDGEIEQLIKNTESLIACQKMEDTPEALATIPLLDLSDINPEATYYQIQKKNVGKTPVLFYNTFTNNVIYVRFLYDMRVLPIEYLPYAKLLAELLGSMNTKNYTFGELDNALNMHTGGFTVYLGTYLGNQSDDQLIPKFVINTKAMGGKINKLFELSNEIANYSIIDDKERLKDVLVRHQSQLEASIKSNGYAYAAKRAKSYYSNRGMFNEITSGVDYYWFITDLLNNYNDQSEEIIRMLNETADLLISKNNLIVTVTGEKDDYKHFTKAFKKFIKTQKSQEILYSNWRFDFEPKNEGLIAASKVQYVVKGYDFKKLGYDWNGKIEVLNQILSRDYLYNNIRVIGGAYGGWCNFSADGDAYFASYRDPNLENTLKTFQETPNFLENFNVDTKEMTRFIIGTISGIDQPKTPSQQGNTAVKYYFENIKQEDLQRERNEVINTSLDDIRNMKKLVEDVLAQNAFCVYGNEEKLQQNKEIFQNLIKLVR
ncbi:MAG: insulinase family protein [Candidatus Marinimicrobia bacterium]|nr:insulinase family protein [Candidatus Neomarinimicrobiota bacterium]